MTHAGQKYDTDKNRLSIHMHAFGQESFQCEIISGCRQEIHLA